MPRKTPKKVKNTPAAPPAPAEHHHILIVGTGFSGLGAAIRLLEEGEDDLVLIERAGDVGGCWRDNTYPGLQCDVQSVVYSFSFAPNPRWSRAFPWGPEIHGYLRRVAEQHDLLRRIRFHTELLEARWDEADQCWRVQTSQGEYTADVLLSAHGGLSEPSVPDIPGLERFEGPVFHSARWRHDVSLAGKRVAVVGTGASAIQVIPAIVDEVGSLQVYQRTPAWVMPRPDGPVRPVLRWLYENVPATQKVARVWRFSTLEARRLALGRKELVRVGELLAKHHLRSQVKDRALRRKLTPKYRLGCKRVLLSNEYYPALASDKTELITDRIREIGPDHVVTVDGRKRPVDVIVLCTGFEVADHPMTHRIHGREDKTLAERWSGGARAYLGMAVAGFPNLFLLLTGPHTGLGHNSIVYMIEAQLEYLAAALTEQRRRAGAVMEVRPEVVAEFTEEMRQKLDGAVWSSGCSSYYLDDAGRNVVLWPGFAFGYRLRTRRFEADKYRYGRRAAALRGAA